MREKIWIDFDGVLHSGASGWMGAAIIIDPPVEGAFAALYQYCMHFDIEVFSVRNGIEGGIDAMKEWIARHDAEYRQAAGIPDEKAPILEYMTFPIAKPSCKVGIDDRVMTFKGTFPSVEQIEAFNPWHHNQT